MAKARNKVTYLLRLDVGPIEDHLGRPRGQDRLETGIGPPSRQRTTPAPATELERRLER
jgi:hypothetical protein